MLRCDRKKRDTSLYKQDRRRVEMGIVILVLFF